MEKLHCEMDKDTRRWRERKKGTWERSQFASRSSPRAKLLSLSDLFSLKFSLFNQSDVAKDLCVSELQLCCIAFVVKKFLPTNCPVICMVPMHFLPFLHPIASRLIHMFHTPLMRSHCAGRALNKQKQRRCWQV